MRAEIRVTSSGRCYLRLRVGPFGCGGVDVDGGLLAFGLAPPATFANPADARAFAVLHGYETAPELTEGKVATVSMFLGSWLVFAGRDYFSSPVLGRGGEPLHQMIHAALFCEKVEAVAFAERNGYRVVEGSAS